MSVNNLSPYTSDLIKKRQLADSRQNNGYNVLSILNSIESSQNSTDEFKKSPDKIKNGSIKPKKIKTEKTNFLNYAAIIAFGASFVFSAAAFCQSKKNLKNSNNAFEGIKKVINGLSSEIENLNKKKPAEFTYDDTNILKQLETLKKRVEKISKNNLSGEISSEISGLKKTLDALTQKINDSKENSKILNTLSEIQKDIAALSTGVGELRQNRSKETEIVEKAAQKAVSNINDAFNSGAGKLSTAADKLTSAGQNLEQMSGRLSENANQALEKIEGANETMTGLMEKLDAASDEIQKEIEIAGNKATVKTYQMLESSIKGVSQKAQKAIENTADAAQKKKK